MQLHEALTEIAEIRAVLERNHAYRGFRSIAIGISACLVLIGGFVQLHYDLQQDPSRYLDIWLCVAIVSLVVTLVEMIVRGRISNDMSVWKMHGKVSLSLIPSFLVGALLTLALAVESNSSLMLVKKQNLWMLPAVWAMVYSLGLFAVCNFLHRTTVITAIYYLAAGIAYLVFNWNARELEAWHMVMIFGFGQFLLAGILYWKVERRFG